jgi:hypothetical protein
MSLHQAGMTCAGMTCAGVTRARSRRLLVLHGADRMFCSTISPEGD